MTRALDATLDLQGLREPLRKEAPVRPVGDDFHLWTPCDVRGFHLKPRLLHTFMTASRYERSLPCHCGRAGIAATVRYRVETHHFDWGDFPATLERWAPDDTSVTEGPPVEDSREVACPSCFGASPPWEWEIRFVGWMIVRNKFSILCLECEAEFGDPFAWHLTPPTGVA